MSKIYVYDLKVPQGVDVQVTSSSITISKADVTVNYPIPLGSRCQLDNQALSFGVDNDSKTCKRIVSTLYANVRNTLQGIETPFVKSLKLVGVGYKAVVDPQERSISFAINLSHPLVYRLPHGVNAVNQGPTILQLSSYDKQALGQACANIRKFRKPDAYKGKGIRYLDEIITLKNIKKR